MPPVAQAANIERVLGVRRLADGSVDYCVKLKERPYREAMWRSGVWMTRFAPTKLRGYRGRAARDGMDDGTVATVAHDAAAAAAAQGLATDEGEPVEPEPAPAPGDAAAPIYVGADVYYPAAYCQIDRVVASRESAFGGAPKDFLVKWRGLGYASSTWESGATLTSAADAAAVARYEAIMAPHRRAPAEAKLPAEGTLVLPPTFKPGCTLRDYQCVSFDWMVRNMRRKRNVILGDEMGLGASLCRSYCASARVSDALPRCAGKTAQSVAVLEHARMEGKGPFLVIAPLTTLMHWQREVHKWTDMNAVVYDGSAADRAECQRWEFHFGTGPRGSGRRGAGVVANPYKFDVLLTTYDTMRNEGALLGSINWSVCVADEAHRLKAVDSFTSIALRQEYRFGWLLMLTGTPVQNDLKELFGLLHILDSAAFPTWAAFQEHFCPTGQLEASRAPLLAAALRPYLLRRMKEDVEDIPEKEEVVVWVEMTADQRAYYKALHEAKIHVLLAGMSRKNMPNSRNLLMELRHCCNHPFLLNGIEADFTRKRRDAAAAATPPLPVPTSAELLIAASGKMVLLNKLLPKLKADGHKVLIFSQFKLVLDLLQDMCYAAGWHAERLDGETSSAERQAGIDRFNTPGQGFLYLLSTRAGGMGITLTAADVAIIYDSDWNPQADLQAMARCHRIGQTKSVRVYRLVMRGTYEEQLLKAAARKFGLEEALLGAGASGEGGDPTADAARLDELLKHGVMAFKDEAAAAETARFCAEDIEDILTKRAERRQVGSRKGNTFSTATFVADEPAPEAAEGGAGEADGAADGGLQGAEFWAAALPDAALRAALMPKLDHRFAVEGPRQRKKVNYNLKMIEGQEEQALGLDSEFSDGYDSDSQGRVGGWTHAQVQSLEQWVVSYGVGRLGAAVKMFRAVSPEITEEDALTVANTLVDMVKVAVAHHELKYPTPEGGLSGRAAAQKAKQIAEEEEAAAQAAGVAEKVDEELHTKLDAVEKPTFAARALSARRVTARMGTNAPRYGRNLLEREFLRSYLEEKGSKDEHAAAGDYVQCSAFPVKACVRSQPPTTWWEEQHDRDLLRGSMRHGFLPSNVDLCRAQLRAMRLDKCLSFKAKLHELAAQKKAADLAAGVGVDAPAPAEEGVAAAPAADAPPKEEAPPAAPAPQEAAEAPPAPPAETPEAATEPAAEEAAEDDSGDAQGPLALPGSMRCGHCRSCTNPRLKQACFTRRAAEGGPLPSGSGLIGKPAVPEVGIEFWPAPAVIKRRLAKLLELLMKPEPEPKEKKKRIRPPQKRVRKGAASPAVSGQKGGRGGADDDDDDFVDEEQPKKRGKASASSDENIKAVLPPFGAPAVSAPADAPMRPLAPFGGAGTSADGARKGKKEKSKVEQKVEKETKGAAGGGNKKQRPLNFKPVAAPEAAPDAAADPAPAPDAEMAEA